MRRSTVLVLSVALASGSLEALPSDVEREEPPIANWSAPPYWTPPAQAVGEYQSPDRDMGRSVSALALPTNPLPFVAVTPCRIVNTRRADFPADFGAPALVALTERTFVLPNGPCTGLPANAGAWSLNITVVPAGIATLGGYLSVYPAGATRPVVSTLNFLGGSTAPPVANAAVVPAGPGGATTVFPSDATHLLIDVNGYYSSQGVVTSLTAGESTLTGPVTLAQGTNVTLTPSGQTVTIAASAGPGGQLPVGSAGSTLRHSGSEWVADSLLYNDATKIGIGTTSPTEQLTLTGNLALPAAGSLMLGGSTFLSSPEIYSTFVGMGGALNRTTGMYNTAFGNMALFSMSTGSYNTAVGSEALRSTTSGQQNVAVGSGSLYMGTLASSNVGVGVNAMFANTFAGGNVAVGNYALVSQSFSNGNTPWTSANTAVGDRALYTNQPTTTENGRYNVAVGSYALHFNASGAYNTAIGTYAMAYNTTASGNTALGMQALRDNTIGGGNVGLGLWALASNTTASQNTAVGTQALYSQSFSNSGVEYPTDNTAVGYHALYANQPTLSTNGCANTAVGAGALAVNTTGQENTALGASSLSANMDGMGNVAIGTHALEASQSASANTAVGSRTLKGNTNGMGNTAVGYEALTRNTKLSLNTAIGNFALASQSWDGSATESDNTAVGYMALYANQPIDTGTGFSNTGVGVRALANNTVGSINTALGGDALSLMSSGSENTAIGWSAMRSAAGNKNTAVGVLSLGDSGTGVMVEGNVAVGYSALSKNVGHDNVAIGREAMKTSGSGGRNTAVGARALFTQAYVSSPHTPRRIRLSASRRCTQRILSMKAMQRPIPLLEAALFTTVLAEA